MKKTIALLQTIIFCILASMKNWEDWIHMQHGLLDAIELDYLWISRTQRNSIKKFKVTIENA